MVKRLSNSSQTIVLNIAEQLQNLKVYDLILLVCFSLRRPGMPSSREPVFHPRLPGMPLIRRTLFLVG